MPWTGSQFRKKHNHSLTPDEAERAAAQANAMLARGVPEGEAIATANKHAHATPAPAQTRKSTTPAHWSGH